MKWLLMILCSLMVIDSSMAIGDPLFIVNGLEVEKSEFESLSPEILDSITVLKDVESTKAYGSRGDYGVIVVTLKCDTPPIFSEDMKFRKYLYENIKWSDKEYLATARLKYRLKADGSMKLIEIDSDNKRFKKRVLKAFEAAPKWLSPAMNMGEAIEIECMEYISLPISRYPPKSNIWIR
ncbi:MAG: hypothetical protein SNG27_06940 [Rikenellaceae bacterium]